MCKPDDDDLAEQVFAQGRVAKEVEADDAMQRHSYDFDAIVGVEAGVEGTEGKLVVAAGSRSDVNESLFSSSRESEDVNGLGVGIASEKHLELPGFLDAYRLRCVNEQTGRPPQSVSWIPWVNWTRSATCK